MHNADNTGNLVWKGSVLHDGSVDSGSAGDRGIPAVHAGCGRLVRQFAMVGTMAAQVTATATIIKLLGGQIGISYEMGALIATAIFIICTAASGLFGVVYTDVVQFFMLISSYTS